MEAVQPAEAGCPEGRGPAPGAMESGSETPPPYRPSERKPLLIGGRVGAISRKPLQFHFTLLGRWLHPSPITIFKTLKGSFRV